MKRTIPLPLSFVLLSLAALPAAGQNQTWIEQFGTSGEWGYAAASDGSGGVFVAGRTSGNLGGPNAGGADAWVAHFDSSHNRTWTRQLGSSQEDFAWALAADGS